MHGAARAGQTAAECDDDCVASDPESCNYSVVSSIAADQSYCPPTDVQSDRRSSSQLSARLIRTQIKYPPPMSPSCFRSSFALCCSPRSPCLCSLVSWVTALREGTLCPSTYCEVCRWSPYYFHCRWLGSARLGRGRLTDWLRCPFSRGWIKGGRSTTHLLHRVYRETSVACYRCV